METASYEIGEYTNTGANAMKNEASINLNATVIR